MPAQLNDTLTLTFPSDVEMTITRTFAAPRHLLFDAITKPEHVRNWYGPSYLTITTCEIDLRVGGKWRYVLQAPDGSEHAFSGEYLGIIAPERLVCTELRYKSKEHRDGHVASGMEGGMRETYLRLDALLATLS